MTADSALEAIRARIMGEWDNPALLAFGAQSTENESEILHIIETFRNVEISPDDVDNYSNLSSNPC